MDQTNNLEPLFESQLKLMEPDIVFIPSLEPSDPLGLKSLITDLLYDIIDTSSIIDRFSTLRTMTYKDEIEANQDIIDIKADILNSIDKVIEEAYEFCDHFQTYSYLWLDDREQYLNNFLTYSRQLTNEEYEWLAINDPLAPKACPPKMEQFREQIDNFENLTVEVEKLEEEEIFHRYIIKF